MAMGTLVSMARRGNIRIQSVRGYRRILDEAIHRARRGELPMTSLTQLSGAVKIGAEMLMAENLMDANGMKDAEVENHPIDQDGGQEYEAHRRPKLFMSVKRTVKSGINKFGQSIDEETETVEGLPYAEDVGEVEDD